MRHPLLLICVSQLCVSLGMSMVNPVLPLYASSFGVSYGVVGLVMASFGVTRVFSEVPGGVLTDRVGRKPLIILGSILSTASHVVAGFAHTFVEVMASRLIAGAGSALLYTSSLTYVGEIAPEGRGERFISYFQSVWSVAGVVGPTLGGLVSEAFSIRVIFLPSTIISAIGVLLASFIKPGEGGPGADSESRTPLDFLEIVADLRMAAISASCFTMFFLYSSVLSTLIPLYGVNEVGLKPFQIGLILSIASTVTVASLLTLTHRVERRLGRPLTLSASLLLCSLAVYLISLASDFNTLALTTVFLGVGFGILQPTPFAILIDYSKAENRGLSMGVLRTFGDLGIILGPILVGWLMDIGRTSWVFYMAACVAGLSALLTSVALREHR